MTRCSIIGCGARRSKNRKNISLHQLPTNEVKKRRWLDLIGTENIRLNTEEKNYICSLHFEENDFNRTFDVVRLREDALPSRLLLPPSNQTILIERQQLSVAQQGAPSSELDTANLHSSAKQIIGRVIQNNVQSTIPNVQTAAGVPQENEKSTTSETNSNTQESETDYSNPVEYLQNFIKQLLPNLQDDNAIFVVLVNNEKRVPNSEPNGPDSFPNGFNDVEDILRKKLAQKTHVAEERRKKIKEILESRRRLIKRNKMLMDIIEKHCV